MPPAFQLEVLDATEPSCRISDHGDIRWDGVISEEISNNFCIVIIIEIVLTILALDGKISITETDCLSSIVLGMFFGGRCFNYYIFAFKLILSGFLKFDLKSL